MGAIRQKPEEGDMGTVITFPSERCSAGATQEGRDVASVIILPVIRIERYADAPSDNFEPSSSSPRGKRRKR
jgi:hypothetical protein